MILDPTRTHLEILRDALDMLKAHPPRDVRGGDRPHSGEVDCAECGFPLTGAAPGLSHDTYVHHLSRKPCQWVRAVAELEAWIRVEEEIEQAREDAAQ